MKDKKISEQIAEIPKAGIKIMPDSGRVLIGNFELSSQQEKFCVNMVTAGRTFNDPVFSYLEAYRDEDLDVDSIIKNSPEYTQYSSNAYRVLSNENVKKRLGMLLSVCGFDENIIDCELMQLIQSSDPKVKLEAIREFNKLKGRIVDTKKVDLTVKDKGLTPEQRRLAAEEILSEDTEEKPEEVENITT